VTVRKNTNEFSRREKKKEGEFVGGEKKSPVIILGKAREAKRVLRKKELLIHGVSVVQRKKKGSKVAYARLSPLSPKEGGEGKRV